MTKDPDGQINVEQRDHLLLIGIDRPEKRNGFTPKIFAELAAAYTRLEMNPELQYATHDHFLLGRSKRSRPPIRRPAPVVRRHLRKRTYAVAFRIDHRGPMA